VRGVLLMAHGTPDSLDEMPDFLTRVRDGRPPSPELVAEMRRNYEAIGGRSPLLDIARAQAKALSVELSGAPVFVGMRNWKPFIADAVAEAVAAGVRRLVAVPMAPQFSTLSVAKYREAADAARPENLDVRFVESWHDNPGLVGAFAQRLRQTLGRGGWDVVFFTAHSVPLRVIEEGDPYRDEVEATARAVAARAGLADYRLAWQSAGRTPEPWLGPSLDASIEMAAQGGARRVLVVPIGFVSDHTEILFDVDIQAASVARARGVELRRTESLNTMPVFIRALAELVRSA